MRQTNDIDCVLLSTSPAAALVQASVAERQIALPPVSRELSVPITGSFDSETDRVVVGAFAMIRLERDDNLKLLIASKIMELAKAGETNPDRLCERTLVGLRGSR